MIIPNTGRVLIKAVERKDALTESGITIPGTSTLTESMLYGEIMSENNESFPKGSKVFYSRYSAMGVVDNDGNAYFIVSDQDILASEK